MPPSLFLDSMRQDAAKTSTSSNSIRAENVEKVISHASDGTQTPPLTSKGRNIGCLDRNIEIPRFNSPAIPSNSEDMYTDEQDDKSEIKREGLDMVIEDDEFYQSQVRLIRLRAGRHWERIFYQDELDQDRKRVRKM